MTDGSVVSLDGGPVGVAGEADADVVSLLEEYLDQARSGQLRGVCVVGLHCDRQTTYGVEGLIGRPLVGAVALMQGHLVGMQLSVETE